MPKLGVACAFQQERGVCAARRVDVPGESFLLLTHRQGNPETRGTCVRLACVSYRDYPMGNEVSLTIVVSITAASGSAQA